MQLDKRMFVRLGHVVGGEASFRIANFAGAVAIARLSGAAVFGIYATGLAYSAIAAIVADNGLQIEGSRQVSTNPEDAGRTLAKLYIAKTLLFLPVICALLLAGFAAHLSNLEWIIGGMLMFRAVIHSYCQMQIGVIKSLDRAHGVGVIQAAHSGLLLVLLWIGYQRHVSVVVIMSAFILGQVLEFSLEAAWLHRGGVRLQSPTLRECLGMVHGATTVGITIATCAGIMRLDVIILSIVRGAAAAGIFAAAQSITTIVYTLGALLASVLFPEMSRLAFDADRLRTYTRHWLAVVAVFMFPGALLGILLGPEAIRALFGKQFGESGRILALLLPAAPFIVLNAIFLHSAFAARSRKLYLGVIGIAAIIASVLNPLMAITNGTSGVALAVVTREIVIFACFWFFSSRQAVEQPFVSPVNQKTFFG